MELSGSILAVKEDYFEYAKMLKFAKVDYLHVDIFQNSNEFTVAKLLGFDKTYLPLDVHLIFESISEEDIKMLNETNTKYLNIQYEALKDKNSIERISKLYKGNLGVAITSKTPMDVIDDNIDYISQVLFMCSEPGISGAKFDESNFERIKSVHERYPSLKLCADGGINNIIGKKMGEIGVSIVVSGSYLCKDFKQLNAVSYSLKYLNEEDINVKREMIKLNSLPWLGMDADFIEIINTMNHYRLGVVLIVDNGKLKGVIADGDVRRGFISYREDIFKKKAKDLMNNNPFVIESDKTMKDIFGLLSTMHRGIDVIPIIEDGELVGAIDLHVGL